MIKTLLFPRSSALKSASSAFQFSSAQLRDFLTVAIFLVGLAVPLGGYLVRAARLPENENRRLNPFPPVKLKRWAAHTFPPMFEAYFNDRVGFRKELLAARRKVAFELLGDSTSDHVWIGRDGWLFINCGGARGGLPVFQPSDDHHVAGWADALADRHAYLADRGIAYVVVIARDKSSVYPEYLSGTHQRHPQPDPLPRVQEKLRGTGVAIVDVLPSLLAAKAAGGERVFFQKDSHWNDAGTFAAYRALADELERLVPGYRGKTAAAFQPTPCNHPGMDLARVLGVPVAKASEDYLFFAEPAAGVTELPAADLAAYGGLSHLVPTRTARPAAAGPPTVFLHDSFGVNMKRFLWSDFTHFAAVGTYDLPLGVLAAERPRLVIQLLVDRTLRHVAPMNPPEVAGYRRK